MKTILELSRDYTITYYKEVKNNSESDTVQPFNKVRNVEFYQEINDSSYVRIQISPEEILLLADKIRALKKAKYKPVPASEWYS